MLHIAYTSTSPPKAKAKNLSQKERLHNEAIASLAERREHDRLRAIKFFAAELKELKALERQLNEI